MVRFRKQTDGFSCGPLALYNALISCGKRVDFSRLAREMGTDRDGTYIEDFEYTTVSYFGDKVLRTSPKPWSGGSVYLASVSDYSGDGHLILLARSTKKSVYVVNWYNSKNEFVHTWIRWETLLKYWDGFSLRIEG